MLDSVREQKTFLDLVGSDESTLAISQQAEPSDGEQCVEDHIEGLTRWRDVSCAWLAMLPEHRNMEDKNCILDEGENLTMTFTYFEDILSSAITSEDHRLEISQKVENSLANANMIFGDLRNTVSHALRRLSIGETAKCCVRAQTR